MKPAVVERDERTVAVENASYRWSYHTLSFALLVVAAYRSLVHHEATWDLLGLVVLGGIMNAIYQGTRNVLHRRRLWLMLAAGAIAAAVALAMAALGIRR